jgi:hypothetical protein
MQDDNPKRLNAPTSGAIAIVGMCLVYLSHLATVMSRRSSPLPCPALPCPALPCPALITQPSSLAPVLTPIYISFIYIAGKSLGVSSSRRQLPHHGSGRAGASAVARESRFAHAPRLPGTQARVASAHPSGSVQRQRQLGTCHRRFVAGTRSPRGRHRCLAWPAPCLYAARTTAHRDGRGHRQAPPHKCARAPKRPCSRPPTRAALT